MHESLDNGKAQLCKADLSLFKFTSDKSEMAVGEA